MEQLSLFEYFGYDRTGMYDLKNLTKNLDLDRAFQDLIIFGQTNPDITVYLKGPKND